MMNDDHDRILAVDDLLEGGDDFFAQFAVDFTDMDAPIACEKDTRSEVFNANVHAFKSDNITVAKDSTGMSNACSQLRNPAEQEDQMQPTSECQRHVSLQGQPDSTHQLCQLPLGVDQKHQNEGARRGDEHRQKHQLQLPKPSIYQHVSRPALDQEVHEQAQNVPPGSACRDGGAENRAVRPAACADAHSSLPESLLNAPVVPASVNPSTDKKLLLRSLPPRPPASTRGTTETHDAASRRTAIKHILSSGTGSMHLSKTELGLRGDGTVLSSPLSSPPLHALPVLCALPVDKAQIVDASASNLQEHAATTTHNTECKPSMPLQEVQQYQDQHALSIDAKEHSELRHQPNCISNAAPKQSQQKQQNLADNQAPAQQISLPSGRSVAAPSACRHSAPGTKNAQSSLPKVVVGLPMKPVLASSSKHPDHLHPLPPRPHAPAPKRSASEATDAASHRTVKGRSDGASSMRRPKSKSGTREYGATPTMPTQPEIAASKLQSKSPAFPCRSHPLRRDSEELQASNAVAPKTAMLPPPPREPLRQQAQKQGNDMPEEKASETTSMDRTLSTNRTPQSDPPQPPSLNCVQEKEQQQQHQPMHLGTAMQQQPLGHTVQPMLPLQQHPAHFTVPPSELTELPLLTVVDQPQRGQQGSNGVPVSTALGDAPQPPSQNTAHTNACVAADHGKTDHLTLTLRSVSGVMPSHSSYLAAIRSVELVGAALHEYIH
eukprot:362866-Chlamydomonas_euryale.AAC.21